MAQFPTQTQLLLHEPDARGEYAIDTSEEFNQDAIEQEPHSPACKEETKNTTPLAGGQGGAVTTLADTPESPLNPPLTQVGHVSRVEGNNALDYAALIENATPAMKQYYKAKAEHPESLLFYRMGDFYEMFFDDAKEAAAILDIALTKRGKQGDADIPMCGVPAHAYEQYAQKLIRAGKRVALCEQMEDPAEAKKRGYKAIVHRQVVRILTPGTLTEEALLEAGSANHLAALYAAKGALALAWVDCSTGEVHTSPCNAAQLAGTLARIAPKELIVSDSAGQDAAVQKHLLEYAPITLRKPDHLFELERCKRRIMDAYALASLSSLGAMEAGEICALGALLDYIVLTQKSHMPRLDMPVRQQQDCVMQIDQSTQRSLELVQRQNGERKWSLLHSIDMTKTASGSRLLARWLLAPLTQVKAIEARQHVVALMHEMDALRQQAQAILSLAADSERALARLAMQRANPRDLLVIKQSLLAAREVNALLENARLAEAPELLQQLWQMLRGHDTLIDRLQAAIKPDASGLLRDGQFIQPGFHAALDEFRHLREHGRQAIAALQQRYQQETGIATLKIKYNQVLGYFVEITPSHQSRITEQFIHRQTTGGQLRYATTELAQLEQDITQSADKALKLELELFELIRGEVLEHQDGIVAAARALAELDVLTALAHLAKSERYVRPKVDESCAFHIQGGRHPVVEKSLAQQGEQFAPNDCAMPPEANLWLLTGPNMAGKSTYLRQNALIAILAQMGSFVPAAAAHIGVIDKCFSRVGAADDLARGQSTFMVEMAETASILSQATARSFVILDEIGRGTATYDGLSIAWAVVEHIHNHMGCRTLFATHYHELTQLEQQLPRLACFHLQVKEWQGQLVFMHRVSAGKAGGSYGVHVAKLAGLPENVVARAQLLLQQFEAQPAAAIEAPHTTAAPPEPLQQQAMAVLQQLAAIRPDELSPRQAQEALYELQQVITLPQ